MYEYNIVIWSLNTKPLFSIEIWMSDLDPRFAVDLSHRILDSCNSTVSERPVFGHAYLLPEHTCKMQSLSVYSVSQMKGNGNISP